ncbi:DNA/RNA non-specific endonuclease [Massilia cavernae]|uniref:Endonuclease n=1 Tax=Massilia cavernae TaxID=2320864 RepID=A0A418Y8E0_9BURK|nr:DNA/RNA non-specific endonuclease [Massilia cavernae]RJG27650.1 DNA/RNA non-specific endonuclease [Massilia cavernae]
MFQKLLQPAALLAAALLFAGNALAGACPVHYVGGRLPEIQNPKLAVATRELCYGVFGVMHSGLTRTALWSAEYLRANNVEAASDQSRVDSFHAEPRLPRGQRAELSDYARSGFDRGHLAPNGNMPDRRSQRESFSLANMVPQDAENNRHVWAGIEAVVRKMAAKEGALYVVTGPAFLGRSLRKVGNVLVPSHLYKVVWNPRRQAGAAWFIENAAATQYTTMSIAQLEQTIGINLMPSLTARDKQTMLQLPNVRQRKARRERRGEAEMS